MKKMKDYHNFYLKYDVLLSVDAFEKFRNNSINSIKNYGLCPSHCSSVPALSWDVMLNISINPILLTDIVKPTISV